MQRRQFRFHVLLPICIFVYHLVHLRLALLRQRFRMQLVRGNDIVHERHQRLHKQQLVLQPRVVPRHVLFFVFHASVACLFRQRRRGYRIAGLLEPTARRVAVQRLQWRIHRLYVLLRRFIA